MQFRFKRAVILSKRSSENIYYCRILPDMVDINQDISWFPSYANFFYKEDIARQPNENVWVLCSDDFQVGFILGPAQDPTGSDFISWALLVNEAETAAGFTPSSAYDLSILKVSGTSFRYENTKTGVFGTIYSNKVVVIVGPNGEMWTQNPKYTQSISAKGDITLTSNSMTETFAQSYALIANRATEKVASKRIDSSGAIMLNAGADSKLAVSGDLGIAVTGGHSLLVSKQLQDTYGQGISTTIATGGHTETILEGDFSITSVVGGVKLTSVTGMNLTTTGSLNITAATGIVINSSAAVTLTSTALTVTSPSITFPPGVVAPGAGPFCALPACLFTGAPHTGNVATGV